MQAATATQGWGARERVRFLADVLGGPTALARLLGVSPSQPTRWRTGAESPGLVVAQRIVALDAVVAQLVLIWDRSLVRDWLTTSNAHLGGARPLDVLRLRGPGPVLEAISAEAAGAFA